MLIELLQREAVPLETLHARYGALLELVRRLLGIVPHCDSYLEIWPPAFRTYNVMVPNLLNLPLMMWGLGAPRAAVGLAMYVSSRKLAAGLIYARTVQDDRLCAELHTLRCTGIAGFAVAELGASDLPKPGTS